MQRNQCVYSIKISAVSGHLCKCIYMCARKFAFKRKFNGEIATNESKLVADENFFEHAKALTIVHKCYDYVAIGLMSLYVFV